MIEVKQLTKRFYDVVALDRVSFEVGKDEVVGFLGPNGAGKSTTLKILTSFMPATSGSATVAGFNVFTRSLDVRRSIGYLPEHVPLYDDMRVFEYLRFRGAIKGVVGRELGKRIDEVLETCGLTHMRTRIIGQLSKGYRQRVGIADALISNPPILLLDEPTGGLDPSQRREMRKLVARFGETHTVLLSSHILAEVESMCSRVIIIKKGRVVADGKLDDLVAELKGGRRIRIEAGAPLAELEKAFNSIDGRPERIDSGEKQGRSFLTIPPIEKKECAALLSALVGKGVPVDEFRSESFSLEEIYMRLTLEHEEMVEETGETATSGGDGEAEA
jgi:ABC-2 type transport system ATP-binding protein